MTEDRSDENIAMLERQIALMLGDSIALRDVICKASEAKMLGLAEAAIYKAVHGDFVAAPSAAGRRFFTDQDHNEWRDAGRGDRLVRLAALATVELQHVIKSLGREAAAGATEAEAGAEEG